MAFKVVTIADRISQYPDRRRLTKEDGSSELVTVAAEEGSVSAEGTEWGAAYANDLETRIDAETHLLEGNFGTVETTTTASKAYAIGDCLVLNGQYYKVIAAISQGATLVVGTNIAVHSVSAINSNLGTLSFAKNADGKWGYKVAGADPVIPFKAAPVFYSSNSGVNSITVVSGKSYLINVAIVSGYEVLEISLSGCTVNYSSPISFSVANNSRTAYLGTKIVDSTSTNIGISFTTIPGAESGLSRFVAVNCFEI